jgi:MoaA/NifB/PqqE/SkfB family radical SAM enzyme
LSTETLNYALYGLSYVFNRHVLRRRVPFIGGMVINDRCNLSCKACRVGGPTGTDQGAADIIDGMKRLYKQGTRSIFFIGGEPMIWKDGQITLENLLQISRDIGFKVSSVYTNGTLPLESSADTLFVSLDGTKDSNDCLRGEIFDRVIDNISRSDHRNIIINSTINSQNESDLEEFCDYASGLQNVCGIYYYFHTPYYGMDELFLDLKAKRGIVKRIIQLKRKGYPIFNSSACLKMVYNDTWKRPSDLCCVWDKGHIVQCCRARNEDDLCHNCGYMGYPEIQAIINLRPSALFQAMKAYAPKGKI